MIEYQCAESEMENAVIDLKNYQNNRCSVFMYSQLYSFQEITKGFLKSFYNKDAKNVVEACNQFMENHIPYLSNNSDSIVHGITEFVYTNNNFVR